MAIKQTQVSVQNDGNYALLECADELFDGPQYRIETYRCSHPDNDYGTNIAGGNVTNICGDDHLTNDSYRIFRHLFSLGSDGDFKVVLEFREIYDEDGGWEIRTRDLDVLSPSFGSCIINRTKADGEGRYKIWDTIVSNEKAKDYDLIRSPTTSTISSITSLPDIGQSFDGLIEISGSSDIFEFETTLSLYMDDSEVQERLSEIQEFTSQDKFSTWKENIIKYQRFGDFRDKAVHSGENLTGPNPQLASEQMTVRAYRASMIHLGAIFDRNMLPGPNRLMNSEQPISIDTKPGVYAVFLNAFISNVELYRMSLDKVHSDYYGVPMGMGLGSRMENGKTPRFDSDRANQTLAELAFIQYVGSRGRETAKRYVG